MKKSTWILWGALLLAAAAVVCFTVGKSRQAFDKAKETQEALDQTEKTVKEQKNKIEAMRKELEDVKAAKEKEDSAAEAENTGAQEKEEKSPEKEPEAASKGKVVGIDPGHQGPSVDMSDTEPNGPGSQVMKAKATTGTTGTYSGLDEYQLNLDVSLKLKKLLEERGYEAVLTRTDNETPISNSERALLAARQGADIYVRIHANGDDTHTASGALAMAPSPENPYVASLSQESQRLSQCILEAYCQATGFENKGILTQDDMTGINWSKVPVTLLEMGFMTSQNDDLKMADSSFQDTMAEGIANGIDQYFEN